MKYLKQFVIGSSAIVVFPFYYAVQNNQPKKTYTYYKYTFLAPIWFGLWNVISLILANYFNLSLRNRFLLVTILSSLSVMAIATHFKSYNFTDTEWLKYYAYIFLKYLIVWNIVIFYLEKYM